MHRGLWPFRILRCGLVSFEAMSSAFACKLRWSLQKNDSIWEEFMYAKYIKGCHPFKALVYRPPLAWRRLEDIRDFA